MLGKFLRNISRLFGVKVSNMTTRELKTELTNCIDEIEYIDRYLNAYANSDGAWGVEYISKVASLDKAKDYREELEAELKRRLTGH